MMDFAGTKSGSNQNIPQPCVALRSKFRARAPLHATCIRPATIGGMSRKDCPNLEKNGPAILFHIFGWGMKIGDWVSIETTNDIVLLRISFLDREEIITSPLTLRFGFQASPVKPVSFTWRAHARILHDIHYDSYKPRTNG